MMKISKKKTIVNLYEAGKRKLELTRENGVFYANVDNWIKKYGTIVTSTGEVINNDEIIK